MATLLHTHSTSPLTDHVPPVPVIPQRRRREPEEVIDVDLLDDEFTFPSARSSRAPTVAPPLRRARTDSHVPQQQPIILIDSDDEDGGVQVVASSSSGRPREQQRPNPRALPFVVNPARRRIFSPSPPRGAPALVPPVPPVPREHAAYQSLPRRERRGLHPAAGGSNNRNNNNAPVAGLIRPIDEPYNFEAAIRNRHHHHHQHAPYPNPNPHPNPHPRNNEPIEPAPRSYHVPNMGFGGALITSNRARNEEQSRRTGHGPASAGGGGGGGIFNNTFDLLALGLPPADNLRLEAILFDDGNPRLFIPRHRMERLRRREEEVEYSPKFTHPHPAEPGFTFDFAPREDGEGGEGDGFPRTSWDEPIVIDDDDEDVPTPSSSSSAKEKEKDKPKLTTTLVCARCQRPLLLGAKLSAEQSRKRRIWGLRCGHLIDEACSDEIGIPPPTLTFMDLLADPKGKGKGRAVDEDELTMPGAFPSESRTEGIRTRLRSRSSFPLPQTKPPPKKKQRTKKKKSGEVEDTYEWTCPVPSCGKVHASTLVDGVWGPEKAKGDEEGRGAINVFV